MQDKSEEQTEAGRFGQMLALDDDTLPWQPEELAAVLRHQLAAPLTMELPEVAPSLATDFSTPLKTVGDLLQHPKPPLDGLVALKNFAKANALHPDCALPQEISSVLYFAAMCCALLRHGQRISALDDQAIRMNVEALLDSHWLDEKTRVLLVEGFNLLREAGAGA